MVDEEKHTGIFSHRGFVIVDDSPSWMVNHI